MVHFLNGARVSIHLSRWNILNTSFLVGTLLLATVLVPIWGFHSHHLLLELVVCLVMFLATGTAVTAGYHRLFSHRTYEATWPLRLLLLCFGAAAFENSALAWASDHRIHHRFVDSERDPYAITKGFWYAHWIWVMESTCHPLEGVDDLQKDPLVRWQHRHYFLIGAVVALIPVAIGLAIHDVWGFIVMGLLLRIVLTHHTTFLINSAAHVFGSRPFSDANTARDNPWLAPLSFGEGFHNFHHMWPADYRNGVRWYQWDSTKWALNAFAWLGLAGKFKRTPEMTIRRARLRMEAKILQTKLDLALPRHSEALVIVSRLTAAHERLDIAMARFQEQRNAWKHRTEDWKTAMQLRRKELRAAWEEWKATRMAVRAMAVA